MDLQSYRFLLSERATMKRFLAETRPDEVIVRKGFEHRLRQVEDELKTYEDRSLAPSDAYVRFQGKPVSGGRGMSARFFGEALVNFDKAARYVGASQGPGGCRIMGGFRSGKIASWRLWGSRAGHLGFMWRGFRMSWRLRGKRRPWEGR